MFFFFLGGGGNHSSFTEDIPRIFLESEDSLPCSQEPATCPYPEQHPLRPRHPILLKIPFVLFHPSPSRSGLANLWHAAYTTVPIFVLFLPNQRLCIVRSKRLHIHISDCIEVIYELQLLPNNTVSDTFLHKSGAVRSV